MQTPHVSNDIKFAMPPADLEKREQYRQQLTKLCGSNGVPAVRYKGETYPARTI